MRPQDTTCILLATARDDSSLVLFVSNASRLHSVSLVHACSSGSRCWLTQRETLATAIQIELRQATHACAEVMGAFRAGADNAYGSVGARCFGVLAALLGGHGGYVVRRADGRW